MGWHGPRGACGCCCSRILERIDELPSQWPCWKGGASFTAYSFGALPAASIFEFDTANAKLRKNYKHGVSSTDDWIAADADLLQLPFSMEYIAEADSFYSSGSTNVPFVGIVGARFNTTGSFRCRLQYTPAVGASSDGFLTAEVLRGAGTSFGITYAYVARNAGGAFKVQYRIQYTDTGITHWLWIDDVAPTEETTVPFVSSMTWGVEKSYSLSGETEIDGSFWQITAQDSNGIFGADQDDTIVFDRLEIRKWDHTEESFPTPDDP